PPPRRGCTNPNGLPDGRLPRAWPRFPRARRANRGMGPSPQLGLCLPEFLIIPKVILLVVRLRSEHQANGSRREVVDFSPDQGREIKAEIRAVKVMPGSFKAVIHQDVKGAGDRNEELVAAFQRMSGSGLAARHIVEVEQSLTL